ncbi:helix-turn-helix domain-containing protein, partial [Parabacteroides sp. OttesenSCG-928-K15]|nr:helix-turn-helix domain-containing protein [Parabacteroides sp. OttesenSCG-928-K15]
MKNCYFILFILLVACPLMAENNKQQQKDSLRQVIAETEGTEKLKNYARLITFYQLEVQKEHVIDTLFTIYDEMDVEARRINNTYYQAATQNGRMSALYNKRAYEEVINQTPKALQIAKELEEWNSYYKLYALLCDTYRRIGKQEQALQSAQEMFEQAKLQNHVGGMALMLNSISLIYNRQRRFAEEEKCLKESISLLQDNTSYLNELITAHYRLTHCYIAQRRYKEALQEAALNEEINLRFEKEIKTPQPGVWFNLYQSYIYIYLQTNEYDLAQTYLDKIDSLSNGSYKMYEERAQVFYGKNEQDKALEMINKAIETSSNPRQPKGVKLMILIKKGEADEAGILFGDLIAELDSIRNAGFNAQLDEIRTEYEVDRHILEKERNRNYALLASAGMVLALLALGIWIAYSRRLQEKNRNLVRRLREQDELDRQLEAERASLAKLRLDMKETPLLSGETPLAAPSDPLYDRLIELINEQVYTDPELNRASLAARMNTNERYLSDLIKRYFDQTVANYITAHRLRYARQQLADPKTDYTIEAIALDSGFGSRATFHQLFRKQYGLSPSEFRRLSLEDRSES